MESKELKPLSLLPCPFCGEELILTSDHHGQWYEHKNVVSTCPASVHQIHDEKDAKIWNTRAQPSKGMEVNEHYLIQFLTGWGINQAAKLGKALMEHFDFPESKGMTAVEWFITINPLLGNISPIAMIKNGRGDKLCKFIEHCINGNVPASKGMVEKELDKFVAHEITNEKVNQMIKDISIHSQYVTLDGERIDPKDMYKDAPKEGSSASKKISGDWITRVIDLYALSKYGTFQPPKLAELNSKTSEELGNYIADKLNESIAKLSANHKGHWDDAIIENASAKHIVDPNEMVAKQDLVALDEEKVMDTLHIGWRDATNILQQAYRNEAKLLVTTFGTAKQDLLPLDEHKLAVFITDRSFTLPKELKTDFGQLWAKEICERFGVAKQYQGVFCLAHKMVMTDGVCPKCSAKQDGLVRLDKGDVLKYLRERLDPTLSVNIDYVIDLVCSTFGNPPSRVPSEEEIINTMNKVTDQEPKGLKLTFIYAQAIRELLLRGEK